MRIWDWDRSYKIMRAGRHFTPVIPIFKWWIFMNRIYIKQVIVIRFFIVNDLSKTRCAEAVICSLVSTY